jgi:hypothetical protein
MKVKKALMKKPGLMILILSSLLSIYNAKAMPLMGGDITWICVGQDSFLIKLVVYRDCNSITISGQTINFKCATSGASITSINLSQGTPVDITPKCNTSCTRCQSSACSFPYGMHRYTMQGLVILNGAGSCCNISISWDGWYGRNAAITTITSASSYELYVEAKLNRCQNPCDNSPAFTNTPILIQCVGQDFYYNHGALDIDIDSSGGLSDSLTYQWAAPLDVAGSAIPYTGQYSYDMPIYFNGFPNAAQSMPKGFHLDAHTGDIQFRPMKSEVTVMVLQVNEFRNGVKIGEIRRDLQIIVINCTSNNPPVVTTQNSVRSINACAGTPVSLTFYANDPNSNDTATISWNSAIPGASWSDNNGQTKHPSATFSWTPSDSQACSLPYTFVVSAKDNACPMRAQFSQSYQIYVGRTPAATVAVSDSGCGKYNFRALYPANTISPVTWWTGDAFTFLPNTGKITSHQFSPGLYHYTLTVNSYGCSQFYIDSFTADSFVTVSLPADTIVCKNSTLNLRAFVLNGGNPYSLSWGSANSIFTGDTLAVKQITVTKDTTIWIRARYHNFNCPWDQIKIKVRPDRKITLPADSFYCYRNNTITAKFFPKIAAFRSFNWYRQGSSLAVDSDAVLNIPDSGQFACVAVDTFGCQYTDTVRIHFNPPVIASAPDSTICFGKNVSIIADSVPGHQYNYQWWLYKSIQSTTKLLKVSPADTTQYSLLATEFLNGIYCSDTHTITINVKPLPVLSFDKFDKVCVHGKQINLDNFVKVNGQKVNDGTWTCPDEPSQVAGNIFFSQSAYTNLNPGYKLVYSYTDNNTACSNSDTLYLLVNPQPSKPGIKISGDTIFCHGNSVSLTTTASATHYGWNTGDTVKQITITTTGKYKMAVTDINGCVSDSSITVKVVVNPLPPKPSISLSVADSFLECNVLIGDYEWYYRPDTFKVPTIIPNNSDRINPKLYCNKCYFNVIYTDSNDCESDTSYAYYFHVNSIDQNKQNPPILIYPNPAHSQLFIENPTLKTSSLILTNVLGNTILQTTIIPGKNELSLTNCKPGIYFIFMDGMITGKLLIQ